MSERQPVVQSQPLVVDLQSNSAGAEWSTQVEFAEDEDLAANLSGVVATGPLSKGLP